MKTSSTLHVPRRSRLTAERDAVGKRFLSYICLPPTTLECKNPLCPSLSPTAVIKLSQHSSATRKSLLESQSAPVLPSSAEAVPA